MGKRELLLIVCFVMVGAAVYHVTAPEPGPGQHGFSFGRFLEAARREVRGNRASAELTTTTIHKLPAELTELRITGLISEVEILVIMLPLTAQTKGVISAARLRRMKAGTKLINVARGSIIDEDALIAVLREGHLGGATLDVFAREPLPAESPLWRMPNVLVTPHVASIPVPESAAKVVAESIRRIARGEPPLHQVDAARGY